MAIPRPIRALEVVSAALALGMGIGACAGIPGPPSKAAPLPETSIVARLGSCDPLAVRIAAEEVLRDPQTLREPLIMFYAASAERAAAHNEKAGFLYLAAKLRTSRQILFEKDDRPRLLSANISSVGPFIMPALESYPPFARRVVTLVIDWDRATPDPFRDRADAKVDDTAEKLAVIDAELARLPDQIQNDPARVAKARSANQQIEFEIKSTFDKRCGPRTLKPSDVRAGIQRVTNQAASFAKTHPFVVAKAGGAVREVGVGSYQEGPSHLPSRLTVAVAPLVGNGFFVEVDAEVTITPDRKLGEVKTSIACITNHSLATRDARWKDVCQGDPNAIKPDLH